MKRFSSIILLVVLATSLLFATGNNKTFSLKTGDAATGIVSTTYADSQVDTLILTREPGVAAMALSLYVADSVSVTSIIARRVVNGVAVAAITADSLSGAFATTAAASKVWAFTMAPLPEQWYIYVTYAGSANGTTSATAKWSVQKQYNK